MFSRSDAIKLSGLTAGQLNYLDRVGIVCPEKPHIRKCSFSWGQIVELRFIAKIRETLSLQKIREAKKSLEDINFNNDLRKSKIVVGDKDLFLITENEDVLLTITGKYKGQFALTQVILCNEVLDDLIENRSKKILDFEKKLEESNVPNIRRLIKAS